MGLTGSAENPWRTRDCSISAAAHRHAQHLQQPLHRAMPRIVLPTMHPTRDLAGYLEEWGAWLDLMGGFAS